MSEPQLPAPTPQPQPPPPPSSPPSTKRPKPPSIPAAYLDPMPAPGTDYPQTLRTGRTGWWRGALALLGFVAGYFIITNIVSFAAILLDAVTGRVPFADLSTTRIQLTPALLLATNVGNALSIPLALLLQWAIFGQPVRYAHSVVGYIRWRLIARSALVIAPIWLLYIVVLTLLGPPGTEPFTVESVVLLVIVLLTTPFQAAGEEYGARGLINRAAGSWFADPRLAVGVGLFVSSLIFCLAHGAGDPWLIAYYFAFGAAMALVVWRSGGLEIACVLHALNNLVAFTVSILAGQSLAIDRSAGTGGPFVLLPIVLLAGVVALVWWRAPIEKVERSYQRQPGDPVPLPLPPGPYGAYGPQSSSDPAQLPGEPPR